MDDALDQITRKIEREIDEFAETAVRRGEYWRASYTPEDAKAVELLKQWLTERGFSIYMDSVGNLFGRIEGEESGVILTGGHRDTVRHDGKYGSGLGYICAMEAVTELWKECGKPRKTVEVVALAEEEGSRFTSGHTGSRALAGVLTEHLLQEKDMNDITLEEAMTEAGYYHGELPAARTDIEHYVELSPEQGPVLPRSQKSVGLVQSIAGILVGDLRVQGEQNHSGTTPMSMRADPVAAAAKIMTDMTKWAKNRNDRVVCTFGNVVVHPGKWNTIAHDVEVTVDIRSTSDALLREAKSILKEYCSESRGKIEVEFDINSMEDPADMDIDGVIAMRDIAAEHNLDYMRLPSGAVHDSAILSKICPCNMIFVPSENGIAHSPLEYTSREDFAQGYVLLKEFLRKMAW